MSIVWVVGSSHTLQKFIYSYLHVSINLCPTCLDAMTMRKKWFTPVTDTEYIYVSKLVGYCQYFHNSPRHRSPDIRNRERDSRAGPWQDKPD